MNDPLPPTAPLRRSLLVAALALALGVGMAVYFLRTRPVPPQRPPVSLAPSVEIIHPEPHHGPVPVTVLGTVLPARQVNLRAQVSGIVEAVSPRLEPGQVVRAGEELVRIDPRDYLAAVAQREAELAQAKAALELEAGRRHAARHDWERLDATTRGTDPRLPLRDPQWEEAQAAVRKAEAALAAARHNLERTRITAPFPAVVQENHIHAGSVVSPQETLAVLVDTTQFWVEASVPLDQLPWLAIPPQTQGSPATFTSASGARAQGKIFGLLPAVESGGRLARLRLTLPRPFEANPPFLLGDTVQVSIEGASLDGMRIPRECLREGNTVWLATNNATLAVRPVQVRFTDAQSAIVQGVAREDAVIRSALPAPVPGMALTLPAQAAR